jgi:hypothetical protein
LTRRADLAAELREVPDSQLEAWLEARSGLPGPRANLELVAAVGDVVPADRLLAWSGWSPDDAPAGGSREFLPVCGVAGMGRLLIEASGDQRARVELLARLRRHATDRRWRVREAVAIALQRWGGADMPGLLRTMTTWSDDADRLVQRAVVAAVSEPPLLRDPATVAHVVGLLDGITATLVGASDTRTDGFRVLRQALGYGWSVAVAADPVPGWRVFGRWADSTDPDISWLVRQNLGKRRMPARPDALSRPPSPRRPAPG